MIEQAERNLSPTEAARLIGCGRGTVVKLAEQKRIAYIDLSRAGRKCFRFTRKAVQDFIQRNMIEALIDN